MAKKFTTITSGVTYSFRRKAAICARIAEKSMSTFVHDAVEQACENYPEIETTRAIWDVPTEMQLFINLCTSAPHLLDPLERSTMYAITYLASPNKLSAYVEKHWNVVRECTMGRRAHHTLPDERGKL
jgi:hypothetical protein